jgi:hypothetical protein
MRASSSDIVLPPRLVKAKLLALGPFYQVS